MRSVLFFGITLLTLFIPAYAGDKVILFDDNDPKMNIAIKAARNSLTEVLKLVQNSYIDAQNFGLKVAFNGIDNNAEENSAKRSIWAFSIFKRNTEPPDGTGLRNTLVKLQPTELAKHQIPCQLSLQLHIGKIVPKPQKQRPKQGQRGISRTPSPALAFR